MTVALPKKAALCFYVIMVVPIYICANSQRDGQTDRQTDRGRQVPCAHVHAHAHANQRVGNMYSLHATNHRECAAVLVDVYLDTVGSITRVCMTGKTY